MHPKILPARYVDSIRAEVNKYIKPIFATENIANCAVFCINSLTVRLYVSCVVNAPLEKELAQVDERQESAHKFIQY